jgi:hypothetical protein
MSKDAPRQLKRRFWFGLAAAAVGLIALIVLVVGALVAEEPEPVAGLPAPSTPGLTTEEQAHIRASEAMFDRIGALLNDPRLATSEEVHLRLEQAQLLLAAATRERGLADRAREEAADRQNAPPVAESDGFGEWTAPTAEVIAVIAAAGTAIAGFITSWAALRKAKPSAG